MKIACLADLHGHNFKEFDEISDRTGSKRLDNIVDCLYYIRDYCVQERIGYLLVAGDLFQTRGKINVIAYNAIYSAFQEISTSFNSIIMIAGNHDEKDNSKNPQSSLRPFKQIDNIVVCESITPIIMGDCNLFCVPYLKDVDRIKSDIQEYVSYEKQDTRSEILLMHAGVSGAIIGESYPMQDAFNLEDLHPEFFKYIVLGHYHKRQFIGDSKNAFYCGSPIQHSFSDEGEDKGFYVIDTSKRLDIHFQPIPMPKFVTVNLDISQEELQKHAQIGNYIRISLKETEVQDFISKVPQELKYKILLEKDYKTSAKDNEITIGMSFNQIISQYAEKHNPDAKKIGLDILREVENK